MVCLVVSRDLRKCVFWYSGGQEIRFMGCVPIVQCGQGLGVQYLRSFPARSFLPGRSSVLGRSIYLSEGLLWCVTCVVGLFSHSLHLHLRKIVLMASQRECADEDEAEDCTELT